MFFMGGAVMYECREKPHAVVFFMGGAVVYECREKPHANHVASHLVQQQTYHLKVQVCYCV